ncbi:glutathione S-transferase family protein [Azospirillum griseum]|uniref:Glutathione S-transferase family protein n=1 Tax=Azospirillum griseum TaxID=2496639 RepID=A0A431VNN6_9PROT|nr:glutathione S-transferase family protein [Azospirillum griseum]RTR24368.1 glutathione S-transferase family protein [Azospirillum griseum]
MILIGQYDSPFVRRVAIALRLYGMAFEHRPWSVFGDADALAAYNPLKRVPTLVLDDGDVLIDSAIILDWLDELAGPERALFPHAGVERRRALKVATLAMGLGDKAVSLVYERIMHQNSSRPWVERCTSQVAGVLDTLNADRAARPGPWWFGDRMGHADIAVGCVLRFVREAHPDVFDATRWAALAAHADACEGLAVFQEIAQPFFVSP